MPEAFIASTTREVHSVAAIEDRDLGEVGEVTRKAAAVFRAHVDVPAGLASRRRLSRGLGSRATPSTW